MVYCLYAFLPLLLMPFPSTPPFFVMVFMLSFLVHNKPCSYCIFSISLLFATTCSWGSDRCWHDLNHLHIFDPIRLPDGSPSSLYGIQLPAFMNKVDDALEKFLSLLGGGVPLARVIRASNTSSTATATVLVTETVTQTIAAAATAVVGA